ncbi:MAG: phosphate starvation protein PhoH [Pseudomonadota bacterium]
MILRHIFEPPDNRRLAHLCGALDDHLRAMEAALGVAIQRREAAFRIDGPKAQAERTLALLQLLHERARHAIPADEFQLMLVQATQDLQRNGKTHRGTRRDKAGAPGTGAAARSVSPRAVMDDWTGNDADPSRNALPAGTSAEDLVLHTRRADLRGRTPNQLAYLASILSHDISIGVGPAGTGKTFLAVACAVDALERSQVQRIVLTRPAVEAGERLGFLPGDLTQKVDPYLRPLYDALYDLMGFERVTKAFEKGQLEIAPLAFMRGRTLNHAFVILDEAQNTTPEQMKMFLTRIGFGSRAVVTGDVSQIDLPRGSHSGLVDAVRVLRRTPGIALTYFDATDVVRHPLVARIVEAYDAARGEE